MAETLLLMLHEHSPFMMSFAFLTAAGNAVVIDGGRPEDMPWLLENLGERRILAWILTHPHLDHISGFIDLVERTDILSRIDRIYYHFPSVEFERRCEPDEAPTLSDFYRVEPRLFRQAVVVQPGMRVQADELSIDFLFVGGERFEFPRPNLAINESSLAFRVTAPGLRSVLFLGDLGPEGGRALLSECGERLPSDIVQMSHHGHSGVTEEVYRKIAPEACLWCAPDWLWEEDDVEFEKDSWGTRHTRAWMEKLGVKENYVTKDGTQFIPLKPRFQR